jgi:hypothetical protein
LDTYGTAVGIKPTLTPYFDAIDTHADGHISDADRKALQTYLDEWCRKVDLTCYEVDYTVAILLGGE